MALTDNIERKNEIQILESDYRNRSFFFLQQKTSTPSTTISTIWSSSRITLKHSVHHVDIFLVQRNSSKPSRFYVPRGPLMKLTDTNPSYVTTESLINTNCIMTLAKGVNPENHVSTSVLSL